MKIDAICVDKSGTKAEVTVDFDYVSLTEEAIETSEGGYHTVN